ncbi:MAG: molybdenum cofactor biosynthesis protein A [Candidatus Methanofastidiosum methylothiophilum]|uniref:Molybdenum cofactor biosynthesis protein A n=1 Tax=Candidatus Methanofastidiosum methylothiophilum TaxID=1705564 RepID=A0A150IJZ8_9EURY|nr:MAG: molybdenum cofactor biosynthesis protein A [Candidatus Methanofastidiosum methylthiophilus]
MKEFHIQWHILDRCNLRCSHCYQDDYSAKNELSIEKLKLIADNIDRTMKRWNSRVNILLTGGEPLLKEGIFELFSYLGEKKTVKETNIITNGTLLSKNIDKLENYKKCKYILFSLDGVTEHTNDVIRGSGVFKKVLEQIKFIDNKRFKKILMFTVSKKNYEDAYNLIEFGKKNNLDGIIIEKLIPLGQSDNEFSNVLTKNMLKKLWDFLLIENGYDTNKSYEYRALKIEYKKRKNIESLIKNFFKKNKRRDDNLYYQKSEGKSENSICDKWENNEYEDQQIIKSSIKVANCIVGRDGCAIMPDGSVFPCRRLPISIGNLLEDEFYEIFENSKKLKDLTDRNLLKGKCKDCDVNGCFGCRAMVYAVKKDLFSEDPHCWK